jgi:hypothetical protein
MDLVMKNLPISLSFALAAGTMSVVGQEPAAPYTGSKEEIEILGPVSDGTVAASAEPKPRLVVSENDVIQTREVPLDRRMVRFQKLRPLGLPPLPAPAVTKSFPVESDAFPQESREAIKDHRFIFVGATVYVPDGDPDQAKSFVSFWPRQGGEAVSMWVNANMLWLGGFADFQTEDTVYSLLMACSMTEIAKSEETSRTSEQEWEAPEIPEFPEGDASFVVVEGQPEPGDMEPFESLIKLYRKDKARLKHAYEMRMAEAERQRLERLADPPELKNLNIRYWRLDEAGRAGVEPKPAVIR